ncbi:MAG: di-heme oxidoredictase family protein [Dongiaceae bacterium]
MKPAACALTLLLCLGHGAAAGEADVAAGEALFKRAWVDAPTSVDAAGGLGPLFNGKACNSCHKDARGARFFELDGRLIARGLVVRLATPDGRPHPVLGVQLQTRAVSGVVPEGEIQARLDRRRLVVEIETILEPTGGPILFEPRVAPSLQGRGLLERVDERAILALADPEDRDGDGISGRARPVVSADGVAGIGRFGAKATAATIEEQTAAAAALDLGLSSPWKKLPHGDCTTAQGDCQRLAAAGREDIDGEEMPAETVRLIAAYVRSLEPPRYPADPDAEALLARSGCTACHHPNMPDAAGRLLLVHTDLLLHDLGADGAGAIGDDFAAASEWRTAPLLDLDPMNGKRRYLHGGAAADLDQAIRLHGGEAAGARDNYLGLTAAERDILLTWLAKL